jgi:hypothetical protein
MQTATDRVLVSSHIDVETRDQFAVIARDNGRSLAGELRFMIREAIASLKQVSEAR